VASPRGVLGCVLSGYSQRWPDQLLPDQELPDQDRPDHEEPDQLLPDQDRPDQLLPDQERPDQELPDQELPDQEDPDHEEPDHELPDQERPFQMPLDHDEPVAASGAQMAVEKGCPKMSVSPARTMPSSVRWSVPRDASSVPSPVAAGFDWRVVGIAAA